MASMSGVLGSIANEWAVLSVFLIPFGGGIPAGVLLAQARKIQWPEMMVLYFISDVILACVFEPLMHLVSEAAKRSVFWARLKEAFRLSMQRTMSHYGSKLSVLGLVLIAFGVDPMTGRVMAATAGHGFVAGWMIAITGDMFYFALLMVSTLWLNSVLGDGTWTTVAILVLMTVVPPLLRRFRKGEA
jgi:uncharacterized membrane protein